MVEVVFYDGESARRRAVSLSFASDAIEIDEAGNRIASWPYDAVKRREAPPGILRLSAEGAPPLARLEVTGNEQAEILARCRNLDAEHKGEKTGRIVVWSLAAALSLLVSVLALVPLVADRAAPLVPLSVERRLGAAVDNQLRMLLGRKICEEPSGQAALRSLTVRLAAAAGLPVVPDVAVLASRIPNAVALPGGRIYLFEGLLDRAESLDEIAGVLAHEMGHVAHRDGLRKLIQTGGSSFLLGLFFGDVTGSGTLILAGRLVLEGAYSRDAERAADRAATEIMSSLGRPSRPMGLLLQRIDKDGSEISALVASHPLTEERLRFLESREPSRLGEPLLSDQEWRDLKSVCKSG